MIKKIDFDELQKEMVLADFTVAQRNVLRKMLMYCLGKMMDLTDVIHKALKDVAK